MRIIDAWIRIHGVEFDRPAEGPLRPQPVPIHPGAYYRQREMDLGKSVVQLQGLQRRRFEFRCSLLIRKESLLHVPLPDHRDPGVRQGVLRVFFQGQSEVLERAVEILAAQFVPGKPPLEIGVIGFRIDLAGAGQTRFFLRREPDFHFAGDRRNNLVLQR